MPMLRSGVVVGLLLFTVVMAVGCGDSGNDNVQATPTPNATFTPPHVDPTVTLTEPTISPPPVDPTVTVRVTPTAGR